MRYGTFKRARELFQRLGTRQLLGGRQTLPEPLGLICRHASLWQPASARYAKSLPTVHCNEFLRRECRSTRISNHESLHRF